MVKQEFIELIQDRLAGGDVPMDVRGKYHPRVIEEWVANAIKFLIHSNRNNFSAPDISSLVQPYSVSVSEVAGVYEGTLSPMPMGGLETIYTVIDSNGVMVPLVKPGAQAEIMSFLKKCSCRARVEGNKIRFEENPGESVTVNMIPSIEDMDDDQAFNLPGDYGIRIIDMIVSYLREKRGMKEDVKNDQVDGSR